MGNQRSLAKRARSVEEIRIKNEECSDLICMLGCGRPGRVLTEAQVTPKPNEMMS